MRNLVSRVSTGWGLVLVSMLGMSGAAHAVIAPGDFEPGDSWYIGPGGTTGLLVDTATDQITRVSDGSTYDLPVELHDDPSYDLIFRLSPSQQYLYVQKSNPMGAGPVCNGTSQVLILLYELGAPPNPMPFSSVSGPACVEGPLSQQPRFYDEVGVVRTMVLFGASGGGTGSNHQVLWADLIRREMATNGDTYLQGVVLIHFAPLGNAALITHGTGRWEEPEQSWRLADALGKRGIPNRVDEWDDKWDHDWPTWREMLPKYLEEVL